MGWKNKLKKYAPIALKIGLGDMADKGEAVSELVVAVQGSLMANPNKASVDSVKVVAAAVDDHQEDIAALKAELAELRKRLPPEKA